MRLVKIVALSNNESSKKIMKLYIKEFYKNSPMRIAWDDKKIIVTKGIFSAALDMEISKDLRESCGVSISDELTYIIRNELEYGLTKDELECELKYGRICKNRCELNESEYVKMYIVINTYCRRKQKLTVN